MKKLFTIIALVTNILFAQQTEFIVGAEHVSAMGNFDWYGNLPHSDYYWNKVKEFGLNYAGLKYFQKYPNDINPTVGTRSKTDIIADINKANALGIKVFLYNGFDHYESNPRVDPQRWVYQVEKVTGNDLNDFLNVPTGEPVSDFPLLEALTHWNLAPPPDGTPNFLHLRPGIDPYGLVASGLREKDLQPDGQKYQLKIRMRLPSATTYVHVPVCTLKVFYDDGAEIEGYVYADDFSNNNWKEVHVMCFMKYPDGPVYCGAEDPPDIYTYPDSIGTNQIPNMIIDPEVTNTPYDYRIYWSSTAPFNYTVDIDYIAVDDLNAHKLFTHVWDNRIEDAVNNDYLNNQGIINFQAHDEVPVTHLFATRYIQQKMQSVLGNSDRYPLSYHYYCPAIPFTHPAPITKRYIWETGMNVLFTFVYPFHWSDTVFPDDPDKNTYDEYVQENTFDIVLIPSLEDHIAGALQFEKPFWFVPQAHKWYKWNQQWQREPSPYEIKAMTNLAVCYGAKGILYYLYAHSWVDRDSINGFYYHDPNNYDGLIREYDDYGYPKWNTIKGYNHQLLAMGDELMSLTWLGATSINQQEPIPNPYITSVQAFSNSVPDPADETYVELGYFKKTDEQNNDNLEHFYVVNRRTWVDNQTFEGDSRDIRIQYDKSSSNPNNFFNWTVKEVGTTNHWSSASPTNQFTATYEPGDGKLFKLQPTVIGGGDLLYNETISSNIELHGDLLIEEDVTLTINSDYHCYGKIYLKEGSKIAGTGRVYFHDGSQIVVSQNAAKIWGLNSTDKLELDFTNEEVSGISVRNGGTIELKYCEIKNAYTGVSTFHSSNSITAEYCTFDNITDYGISVGNNNTDLDVEHCTFNNCGDYCINILGSVVNNPYIYDNTFIDSYGAISAVNNNNQVTFLLNSVENSEIGVYGSNVASFAVLYNTFDSDLNSMPGVFFESCGGVIAGNTITGYSNGISLGNSSPYIGSNEITYNLYHGLSIGSGSNPVMAGAYFYTGYNTFQNNGNSTTGTDGSEIYFGYNSNAIMSRGCNSIIDDRCPPNTECNVQDYPVQLLMNSSGLLIPITVEAEYNYWGNSQYYDLEDRFGNLIVYYEPYYGSPCTYEELTGGESLYLTTSDGRIVDTTQVMATDSLTATEMLSFKALKYFLTADYDSAETICNQIVNSNDTLFAKLEAYQMLYQIGKIESKPVSYFTNLYNTFSGLSQSTSDSLLIKLFTQLGSLSLIGKQEYISAIDEFDDVIEQNPNTEEAVFAEIDALTTGLLIENDTTLGKTKAGKYLVKSDEYQDRIKNILKKNFGVKQNVETTESIPKQYQLYQNYPNPFNPVTTIKYDIVKPQNVKVTIFDILGRQVTTLVNTQQQPGTYTITWDASNVASGIYFYQLKTNDYVDTKKMILLK